MKTSLDQSERMNLIFKYFKRGGSNKKEYSQTKIRLLTSINYPKIISLYKISRKDILIWKDKSIGFLYHPEIKKEHIVSISEFIPKGPNFEPWIKIEYKNADKDKSIYICSRRLFFDGGNQKILINLKTRYLN